MRMTAKKTQTHTHKTTPSPPHKKRTLQKQQKTLKKISLKKIYHDKTPKIYESICINH